MLAAYSLKFSICSELRPAAYVEGWIFSSLLRYFPSLCVPVFAVGTWKRPSTVLASYWNAGVTGHAVNVNRANARAAAPCANGRKIPVCTSQRVILNVA